MDYFYKDNKSIDGLRSSCKYCHRKASAKWHKKTYNKHLPRRKEYLAQRLKEDPLYKNKLSKATHEKRKLRKPKWIPLSTVKALYRKAKVLGKFLDHIIPLCGTDVSGLNVPWNVQFIDKKLNAEKGNWFDNTSYQEWRKRGETGPLVRS